MSSLKNLETGKSIKVSADFNVLFSQSLVGTIGSLPAPGKEEKGKATPKEDVESGRSCRSAK